MKMSRLQGVAPAFLLLAAGTPVAAQVVNLECQAEVEVINRLTGQVTERGSRGTWEFVLDTTPGRESVLLKSSSIYRLMGTPSGDLTSPQARDVQATEDAITFCLMAEGCDRNIPNDFGGHTKVLRSVLDRRQSRFGVTVEEFLPDLRSFDVTRYFGACAPKAPPPERQF